MRDRQRILWRRAPDGTALHQRDANALLSRVRRLPAEDRRRLSRSRHHPPGYGQPLHAHAEGAGRAIRRHRRDLIMEPLHGPLPPKHGSWLNQAEIEVSLFSRQCLGKRRIGDIPALRKQAHAWNRRVNKDKSTIQWKFTRQQARKTRHYTITRSKALVCRVPMLSHPKG